jgi:triphosphoribosyl-dephospho-CoA synthase
MSRGAVVGHCASLAGLLEVTAEKPGNVTPTHDFPDTKFHHFLASSIALEAPMRRLAEDADYRLGQGILDAVVASNSIQRGGNAQLGVILLFSPVAKAAGLAEDRLTARSLKTVLQAVLRATNNQDALDTFEAINYGHVGGLNDVEELDVRKKGTYDQLQDRDMTLIEWMKVGAGINSVCSEYATGYKLTFGIGLPTLLDAREKGLQGAIVHTYLTFLSRQVDTHITGKWGKGLADKVTEKAAKIIKRGSVWTKDGMTAVRRFQNYLNKGRINPGATADLTASTIFVALLTGLEP